MTITARPWTDPALYKGKFPKEVALRSGHRGYPGDFPK